MNEASAAVLELAASIAGAGARGVSCRRNPGCAHLHLDLRPLRELRFYQPADLTVGVDAGMSPAELNAILAPQRQWVPLDVANPGRTTLGAVLACHRSGPLRQRFGTVRDFVIGMEMATAVGELVHAGGRVVKNVAGYDWGKVMIGSRGALGIMTGVNFRVYPRPEGGLTAGFGPLEWEQVEALRHGLLHSPLRPLAIELWRPAGQAAMVVVRCAGSAGVRARCRHELEALAGVGKCAVEFPPDELGDLLGAAATGSAEAVWQRIQAFPQDGDRQVAMPPAEAVRRLGELDPGVAISGRLGLGVYWIRGAAPGEAPNPGVAGLMARLKRELDPEGRLHGDDCVR